MDRHYMGGAADYARSETSPHTVGTLGDPRVSHGMVVPTDESDSRIRNYISGAEQMLSELQNAIDLLEKRLDTALTPVPPSPAGNVEAKRNEPIRSHIAGRLAIVNEGTQFMIGRLHQLRSRVEV